MKLDKGALIQTILVSLCFPKIVCSVKTRKGFWWGSLALGGSLPRA